MNREDINFFKFTDRNFKIWLALYIFAASITLAVRMTSENCPVSWHIFFATTNIVLLVILVFTKIFLKDSPILWIIEVLALQVFNIYFIVETYVNTNQGFLNCVLVVANLILYLCLYLLFMGITRRIGASLIIVNAMMLFFGVANYELNKMRGSRLFITDFYSVGTAANVAENYDFVVTKLLLLLIAFTFCLTAFGLFLLGKEGARRLKLNWKAAVSSMAAAIIVIGLSMMPFADSVVGTHASFWSHKHGGYLLNNALSVKELRVDKPMDYSVEALEKLSTEYTAVDKNEKRPDVIVIMNESYTNFETDDSIKTNLPITPFIDGLRENIIHGTAYSSVFGGGTANSEYEFLTGDSTILYNPNAIVYQTVLGKTPIESLVSHMKSLGYKTIAMHPYKRSGWNREAVYEAMGFDETCFFEDFKYREYLRIFISDKSDYKDVLDKLRENEDQPVFIFNITMQNHGGYYEKSNTTAIPDSIKLETKQNDYDETFANLMNETDKANEMLIEELSKRDKDTVVLLFGDHQPSMHQITNSDPRIKYTTNFFLWANFDIEEKTGEVASINYLSNYLMDAAGLPKSKYMQYLDELQKKYPVITQNTIFDADGNYYEVDDYDVDANADLLQYKQIIYNHCVDSENTVTDFFQ